MKHMILSTKHFFPVYLCLVFLFFSCAKDENTPSSSPEEVSPSPDSNNPSNEQEDPEDNSPSSDPDNSSSEEEEDTSPIPCENDSPTPLMSYPQRRMSYFDSLEYAIKSNQFQEAKRLIACDPKRANPRFPTVMRIPLLSYISIENRGYDDDDFRLKVAKFLVAEGADIETKDYAGHTALFYHARDGRMNIVKFLLSEGAEADAGVSSSYASTPLTGAAKHGHLEIVKLLINEGASVDGPSRLLSNERPLTGAAENGHLEIVKLLISEGANIDVVVDRDEENVLTKAAGGGHLEIVKFLVENQNMSVNTSDEKDKNTLIYATLKYGRSHVRVEVIQYLLDKGVDINHADDEGNIALHYAARGAHSSIVKMLLDKGTQVDKQNQKGETPLMSPFGSFDILLVRLASSFPTNALKTIKLLVEQGNADLTKENTNGETVLAVARAKYAKYSTLTGLKDIVDYLVSKNAPE